MVTALCRLGEKRKAQIRSVEERCMKHDGTEHRIYLDSDVNLYPGMKCFFLFETAANGLMSVLAVTNMESAIGEITAFTDPAFRGRGLFRKLLEAAVKEMENYGIERFYFVHEPGSADGKAVLKKLGCRIKKSEYLMKLNLNNSSESESCEIEHSAWQETECGEEIRLIPAKDSDITELTPLLTECFGMDYEFAEDRLSEFLKEDTLLTETNRQSCIIWKALSNGNTTGMCACCMEGTVASLFDICVSGAYRRRGIGTRMLSEVLAILKAAGAESVILQVGSVSKEAVRLYRRLGFEQADRLDYYSYRHRGDT